MSSSSTPGKRIAELNKHIATCQREKANVIQRHAQIEKQYKRTDYGRYLREVDKAFGHRKPEQLVKYYDDCIVYYTKHLNHAHHTHKSRAQKPRAKSKNLLFIITVAVMMLGAGLAALLSDPSITGLSVANESVVDIPVEVVNETPIELPEQAPENIAEPIVEIPAEADVPLDIPADIPAENESIVPVDIKSLGIRATKAHYKASERPQFTFTVPQGDTSIASSVVTLVNPLGEERILEDEVTQIGDTMTVTLEPPRSFTPGRYKVIFDTGASSTEKDFTWGVLALNTDKSIYKENEPAFISMAVLDDEGNMVCDAHTTLTITSPSGENTTLSTVNGGITISPECVVYGVTNVPDYYAYYSVGTHGVYTLSLSAETNNGIRTITDSIVVKKSRSFDVSRDGPTRIYPIANYTMKINITSAEPFFGIITEYVPASFAIVSQDGLTITTVNDTKMLTWQADIPAGQNSVLSYTFDAPDSSPEFYLLGPLEIGSFAELRQWQIASDAPAKIIDDSFSCDKTSIAVGETTLCTGQYDNSGNSFAVTCTLSINNEGTTALSNSCGGNALRVTAIDVSGAGSSGCSDAGDGTASCVNWPDTADNQVIVWTLEGCAVSTANTLDTFTGCSNTLNNNAVDIAVTAPADTTVPEVTVAAPSNGTNLSSGTQTFSAQVKDASLTDMRVIMQFNDTGILFNESASNSSGTWSVSSLDLNRLAEGLQRMTVFANDSAGKMNSTEFVQFTVDRTAPQIIFTNTQNAVYTRASFNQTFTMRGNDTVLTIETIRLSFNNATGAPFNATAVNNSGAWVVSYNVSTLSEGIHTITAIANDSVGNFNRTQTLIFTVDLNGPNATNITPQNDSSFSTGATIEIGLNLTENVLYISNASFNITYPNSTVSSTFYLANDTQFNRYVMSYIIPSSIGTYNISFFANDTTGNSIRVLSNFTVLAAASNGAANVTNLTPQANSMFNASQFIEIGVNVTSAGIIQNVTANVSFPNGSTILYYLQNGTNYGTRFNISFLLDLIGNYNVTFAANDTSNNLNSTEKTNFTVNSAPQIVFVSTVPSQTITEAGTTQVNFSFLVYDENGAEDIVNATAQLRVNLTGETDRTNSSCHPLAVTSTNTVNYTCSINIWYFDNAGNWTVNVSIKDRQSNYTENSTRSFELYSTTAMQMYPTSVTWPSLELGTVNRTSNNDPLIINNTGNKDIGVGSITVTAYSPQGIFTATEFIDARNFTISPRNGTPDCTGNSCFECNGTTLINQSAAPIISANISAGNLTLNDLFNSTNGPQETLFLCIPSVPTTISRQTFATNGTHTAPWIISVS